jgi:hypothetical protein
VIDASYFKDQLAKDLHAFGGRAVVEVRLLDGRLHRVHKVLTVGDGYVILEAYERRGNEAVWKDNWLEQVMNAESAGEVSRAIVSYESILDVIVVAGKAGSQPRIGFGTAR